MYSHGDKRVNAQLQLFTIILSHVVVSLFSIFEFDCPSGIFRPSFVYNNFKCCCTYEVKSNCTCNIANSTKSGFFPNMIDKLLVSVTKFSFDPFKTRRIR